MRTHDESEAEFKKNLPREKAPSLRAENKLRVFLHHDLVHFPIALLLNSTHISTRPTAPVALYEFRGFAALAVKMPTIRIPNPTIVFERDVEVRWPHQSQWVLLKLQEKGMGIDSFRPGA